jgi:integrase/recombinase XerD
MTLLAPVLEKFFTKRLRHQRDVSPNTIAAYRDAFRLLLRFAQRHLGKPPSAILLSQIDAPLVGAFLDHLEKERRNSARTRNARLAAIHSFFHFVALEEPADAGSCQRVLAIPTKKTTRRLVTSLTRLEADAIVAAPDRRSWLGRRDHALIVLCLQTGLRVSEVRNIRCQDIVLTTGPHVRCSGKGRKERCTPLTHEVVHLLKAWLVERAGRPDAPAFPSRRGTILSTDAIERMLTRCSSQAAKSCRSLRGKKVTPHILRHTAAVSLLQAGVDRTIIALWLGHESVETTQMYLDADLSTKERAIARTAPLGVGARRYRPPDTLLAFLEGL